MTYNAERLDRTEAGPTVTVRLAGGGDSAALVRLAALDSAAFPEGPTLLAEVDGVPVAALPVHGGRPIADPFSQTVALVQMLRLRAQQLRGEGYARKLPIARRGVVARILRPDHPSA